MIRLNRPQGRAAGATAAVTIPPRVPVAAQALDPPSSAFNGSRYRSTRLPVPVWLQLARLLFCCVLQSRRVCVPDTTLRFRKLCGARAPTPGEDGTTQPRAPAAVTIPATRTYDPDVPGLRSRSRAPARATHGARKIQLRANRHPDRSRLRLLRMRQPTAFSSAALRFFPRQDRVAGNRRALAVARRSRSRLN